MAAAWKDVEQAEPGFVARVRRIFKAGRHKTIAPLRADGSCGSRASTAWPDVYPQESKGAEWPGEAKIAGRAVLAGPNSDGPQLHTCERPATT